MIQHKKKTLFFDLGGVILFFSHELMCRQIAQFCQLPQESVKRILFSQSVSHDYELGHLTSRQLHQLFCQITQRALDFSGLMHAASSIFSPNLEMLPLLTALKKQGIKLYILSNTCEAHFLYAKKNYRFLTLFDGYILSYEIKKRKPNKEIFFQALRQAQAQKEQCYYIDDLIENIEAARYLGIDSHHFNEMAQLMHDLERQGIAL